MEMKTKKKKKNGLFFPHSSIELLVQFTFRLMSYGHVANSLRLVYLVKREAKFMRSLHTSNQQNKMVNAETLILVGWKYFG